MKSFTPEEIRERIADLRDEHAHFGWDFNKGTADMLEYLLQESEVWRDRALRAEEPCFPPAQQKEKAR